MLDNIFGLVPGTDRDTIQIYNSPIIIEVFNLRECRFEGSDSQLVFYTTGRQQLAFLVNGWDQTDLDDVSTAIRWYGITQGYGELDIILKNPRLRLVS